MKKILVLLVPVILGILFFGLFQYFVTSRSQKGALQVTSSPESKVYLNNKYLGQSPICKCESQDMQKAGTYTIRLVPNDRNLPEFQEKITITGGVLTVVDRKFGKGSDSSGSVISLTPINERQESELVVVSIPSRSRILLDNNPIGETPILFKNPTESDHVLEVEKEGYSEKTVRIRTPLGYKLTVTVYLSTDGSPQDLSTPSASASAALSPTSAPNVKVTILDTPTGFLRVRESASIAAGEVGRVNPGESFDLVSEQTGWYEIKLKTGSTGFISSQYASKQ